MTHNSDPEEVLIIPAEHWRLLDVFDVEQWDCLPLMWMIEGMVAVGNLVLIGASTQTGKTLLGLDMATVLACGGDLFGRFPVDGGWRILYLALEDPDRRIKDRLLDIRAGGGGKRLSTKEGQFMVHLAPGLNLNEPSYFVYLEKLIVEGGFNVVFIDTYQKATPGLSSFNDEAQSVILHRLSDLTRKHYVTLIILDHLRKAQNQGRARRLITIDDIKGTGGKAQNADVVILLERLGPQISFRSFSKDADTPVQILLDVSRQGSGEPKFQYAGELDSSVGNRTDHTCRKVWDALSLDEPVPMSELVKKTGLSAPTIRRYLVDLINEGRAKKEGVGRWTQYSLAPASFRPNPSESRDKG